MSILEHHQVLTFAGSVKLEGSSVVLRITNLHTCIIGRQVGLVVVYECIDI